MKFLRGLRILLTNSWYNYSFILSLVATAIISIWLLTVGSLTPDITDPFQGLAISVVVSFQYFILALVVLSVVPIGRHLFFDDKRQLRNQILLSVTFILVFMVLGGISAAAGPIVGAGLAFGDSLVTAYFTVLLGWNIGKSLSEKLGNTIMVNWSLFILFLLLDIMVFGGGYMFLGLATLPFEQQIVLLMFPLVIIALPIITIIMRNKTNGPEQSTVMGLILFGLGIYYTFRLISITEPQFTLLDLALQLVLLVYGLSSTTAKVHEDINLKPLTAITVLLLVILARVGSQVNRLLAAATGWGNAVQVGITSFTILNLAILGLLVPVYWMWRARKHESYSVPEGTLNDN
jgi:hypothetical protein